MKTFSLEEVQQVVQQAVEQATQQVGEQLLQAAQQTGGSLSSDQKNLGYQKFIEDPGTDEANKLAVLTNTRAWDHNVKSLVEDSRDYDKAKKYLDLEKERIEVARNQSEANKKSTMDHVESMMSLLNVYAQVNSVNDNSKFSAAVSEPISPNTK